MSIDERMQREPNLARIKKEIAPYLASHPDRFFGSLIVLVPKDSVAFEPVGDIGKVPLAYAAPLENVGFITLGSGDRIALDGQHRLMALREVLTSRENYGPLQGAVGDDDVSVLLIEFEDDRKTRTIFNKVNRHARPVGAADNIITSETDGYAIVSRMLLDSGREGPLAARPVNGAEYEPVEWGRNSLSKTSTKLTTLTALYEGVIDILRTAGYKNFSEADDPVAPPESVIEEAFETAANWWSDILELEVYRRALSAPEDIPGIRYSTTDRMALLLRPVGQIALVKGLAQTYRRNRGAIPVAELVRRAGLVDWSPLSTNHWRDVIVKADGGMIARKEGYALAANLLEYLISPTTVSDEDEQALWASWNKARGKVLTEDPEHLQPEEMPQDLPTPVV
jgi:DNA sulfur modification protein DndB